jgi:hypothetical protein
MIFTRSRERDNNGMPAGALEFSKLNCRMLRRWPSLARDARARGRVTARGCQHRARIRIPSAGKHPPTRGHTGHNHDRHRYSLQGCENTQCFWAHAWFYMVLQLWAALSCSGSVSLVLFSGSRRSTAPCTTWTLRLGRFLFRDTDL